MTMYHDYETSCTLYVTNTGCYPICYKRMHTPLHNMCSFLFIDILRVGKKTMAWAIGKKKPDIQLMLVQTSVSYLQKDLWLGLTC